VGTRTFGKSAFMTESGSSSDPATALEREADRLEHHLEQLGDHITDAQKSAAARREEAMPAEKAVGDWEDTKGTPGQGEDPEGAVEDDAPTASADDAPSDDSASDTPPERDDPVGSRMPGHASGGDD
jgi:hypothetical protein